MMIWLRWKQGRDKVFSRTISTQTVDGIVKSCTWMQHLAWASICLLRQRCRYILRLSHPGCGTQIVERCCRKPHYFVMKRYWSKCLMGSFFFLFSAGEITSFTCAFKSKPQPLSKRNPQSIRSSML